MLLQAMQVLLTFEKYSGPDRKRFLLLQLPAVAAAVNTFFSCVQPQRPASQLITSSVSLSVWPFLLSLVLLDCILLNALQSPN
jgi:hypothetical protein